MSRYKAYPEYLPSDAGLVYELPIGWRMLRGKYVFSEYSERSEAGEEQLLSVSEYYGVKPRGEVIEEGDFLSRAESLVGYKKCQKNDLVMNIMLAWKCGLGVSKYDGIVSPAYSVFRFNGNAVPDYMHYLLRTETYTGHFKTRSTGVIDSRLRLYPESFGDVSVILPPTGEQEKIVAFLDYETAKIDALIEKQQRLIELLKEKRQAVISHAVTKGLNPNAPMKDSGVEWLGEVPAHWLVAPLKRFAEVIDCKHYTVQFLDEGLPIVSIRELRDDSIDLANAKMTSRAEWDFLREGRVPRKGDIVFCRNASVGAAGYVEGDAEFCMGQDVCLIRTGKANRYMHFQITSCHVREQIEAFLVGATIRRANVEEIRRLVVAQPPEAEQIKIAQYLENTLSEFDALSDRANRTVELLQERRTALISAAVTGKIDVRDWQHAAA
ncbi:restriction endonuclease subunit S [Azonexus sp. R2A61]|uniref:restriction endonuclease subunit S n=1 Tax=Azonexus sp. R2A61 TaxID=2744443 RepID=UPI001F2737BD|nr:restriction endonuclease subunit S [Azonexus sp. R2A61]